MTAQIRIEEGDEKTYFRLLQRQLIREKNQSLCCIVMHLYILTLITPEMSYYLGLWCLLLNRERVQNNFKTKGEVRMLFYWFKSPLAY